MAQKQQNTEQCKNILKDVQGDLFINIPGFVAGKFKMPQNRRNMRHACAAGAVAHVTVKAPLRALRARDTILFFVSEVETIRVNALVGVGKMKLIQKQKSVTRAQRAYVTVKTPLLTLRARRHFGYLFCSENEPYM